jgi:hypothetical protein
MLIIAKSYIECLYHCDTEPSPRFLSVLVIWIDMAWWSAKGGT